jgi:hypothetical protein
MMKKLLLVLAASASLSCTPAKAPSVESVARVLCDAVPVLISTGVKLPDEVLEYVNLVCHLTAEESQALKAPSGADAGAE